jgi:TonB-linked SusC/RagA family outer membrane protein
LESAIDYNRTFNDKHTVSGLLVYIMRSQLNGNAGSLELSLPFRNVGVSGRTTYAYDRRYFVEFNFGLNGSERFHKSQRFGFFPSLGLAWTISNEAFWEPMKDVVSNFRIRGTYGLVGNDAIGGPADRFFYLSNVNMQDGGRAAYFGTDHSYGHNGISILRYPNEDITWETSYKSNLAIEMGLFEKTNIQVDLFKEKRKNILMERSNIPTSMGLSSGISANVGEASGKGIDLSIDHSQAFQNRSWLQSRINFTYATSKYDVYEEPQYKEPWLYRVGYPISVNRGLIAERLFIDDQDVSNSPTQHFGEVRGGDIKYIDVNKDGQITDLDRVPIGYPTIPEINYGFGFSYGIKNLDLSVFFQGSARSSFWIDPSITAPFVERTRSDGLVTQTQLLKAYADDHWSESNQNIYALWPRLSETLINNNLQTSTWFMRDGSFLRFKQLEVGYSLPDKLSKKIKMSNFRLYASGTNLMVWSKFKLWDVEMAGNGLGYPIQRVYNLGIQLSF